jgi:HPr kinase/phosphorylase
VSRPHAPASETLHATTVALPDRSGRLARGLLILGQSGSGKSALALRMIALGAQLVADDRTVVTLRGDRLIATAPPAIRGLIEARGLGVLRVPVLAAAQPVAVLDLDRLETERMPEARRHRILGVTLPLLRRVEAPHFPAALLLYLSSQAPPAGGARHGDGN